MDHLRDGAAVIYLEGTYDRKTPAPVPEWTTGSPPLGVALQPRESMARRG